MKSPRTIADAASFALFKKGLPFAFLLATFVLLIPLILFGEKYKIEALRTIGCIVFLVGFLASIFTSREIIIRMEEDRSVLFSDAFAHTLYGYLTFLCFLPVLGPTIQRFLQRRGETNHLTSHEE